VGYSTHAVKAGQVDLHGPQQVSSAYLAHAWHPALHAWHPALHGEHTHLMMAPMQPHLATVAQQPRHDMHTPHSLRVQLQTRPMQLKTQASQLETHAVQGPTHSALHSPHTNGPES